MYIQLIGNIEALPYLVAATGPILFLVLYSRGSDGIKSFSSSTTQTGQTPGPPPPCGMQKVL